MRAVACLYLLFFLVSAVNGAPAPSRPNVIIVITDDQGKGDLGCYGNKLIRTPSLDRFFSRSVRLDNFHVSTTCAPTRSALMTGRHTNRLNTYHTVAGRAILYEDETLMPEIFAMNGYATGMFGKWHLGDNYPYRPEDRGFQSVVRHGGGGITQAPDFWGNDYFDDTYWTYEKGNINSETRAFKGYCTDVFFSEAFRFIEEHKSDPFFCYISTNAPHGPLNVPAEYLDRYKDQADLMEDQKRFYAMITNIDDNFRKLEDKLEALGIAENTIVIFMTDNGTANGRIRMADGKQYGFNAGLKGAKGSHYEGGHRVPMMIRWPGGGLTGGKDITQLTAHFDIFPTLMELTRLKYSGKGKALDGISLVPLLKGHTKNWPDRMLFVDTQRMTNLIKYRNYCVMDENFRLIDGTELYNIKEDLGQTRNIAADHPEVVKRLKAGYEQWWESINASELNSRYSYIKVGTRFENPVRISAHDLVGGEITSQVWHQIGAMRAGKSAGVFKIEVAEEGQYKIRLRRFPVESGLGFNDSFGETPARREIEKPDPASNNVGFTGAYFNFAGIEKQLAIKERDQELVIEARLHPGKYDLEARFFDKTGQAYPCYYVYFERMDIAR